MDISGLLGPGILDPIAIGERVFQELQHRLPPNSKLADISDKSPEELVAATIADWLAKMMMNDDSPGMAHRSTIGNPNENQMYKDLYDRNIVLAAALGACGSCWGGNVDCPICDGAGAPGWALPDEQLYASYVEPAVRAVTNTRGSVYARAQEQELSMGGNMPTTPPTGTDTDTANVLEGEDPMEYHAGEMSGDAGTSGLEGSEAMQAKAQAIALSKAAEAAKARYARLSAYP
jgi:hypothetical protein